MIRSKFSTLTKQRSQLRLAVKSKKEFLNGYEDYASSWSPLTCSYLSLLFGHDSIILDRYNEYLTSKGINPAVGLGRTSEAQALRVKLLEDFYDLIIKGE